MNVIVFGNRCGDYAPTRFVLMFEACIFKIYHSFYVVDGKVKTLLLENAVNQSWANWRPASPYPYFPTC